MKPNDLNFLPMALGHRRTSNGQVHTLVAALFVCVSDESSKIHQLFYSSSIQSLELALEV
jgi:hypothetical protein